MRLESLQNTARPRRRTKLLGRGPGSGHGKTCCRGHKGAGSRSGYKVRLGTEGGGIPLYRKLPTRGFSNARFSVRWRAINLFQIEKSFEEGEVVNPETLQERGLLKGHFSGVKILGQGSLSKKLTFQATLLSESAKEKLTQAGIAFEAMED